MDEFFGHLAAEHDVAQSSKTKRSVPQFFGLIGEPTTKSPLNKQCIQDILKSRRGAVANAVDESHVFTALDAVLDKEKIFSQAGRLNLVRRYASHLEAQLGTEAPPTDGGILKDNFRSIFLTKQVGRPTENLRQLKQSVLTFFAKDERVTTAFLHRTLGRVGPARWKVDLERAKARGTRHDASRKFWDPTATRSDKFSERFCQLAKAFWQSGEISRQLPDTLNKPGQLRFALCVSPEVAHRSFIEDIQNGPEDDQDFKCGLTWFKAQRPPNVIGNKRQFALCIHHLRDFHIMDALYRFLRALHKQKWAFGATVAAKCTQKCMEQFPNMAALRDYLNCHKETIQIGGGKSASFLKQKCIKGSCDDCHEPASLCPLIRETLEGNRELNIRFMKYVKEQDAAGKGTVKPRDTFTAAESSLEDFVNTQVQGWSQSFEFKTHRFHARWQNKAFDIMQSLLADNKQMAVIVIDFAMNWSGMGNMDFSQSFFSPLSATLVPVVLTLHRDSLKSSKFDKDFLEKNDAYLLQNQHLPKNLVRITLMFCSEDKNHDTSMVKKIVELTMGWLRDKTQGIKRVEWWSDGCRVRIYPTRLSTCCLSPKSHVQ